MPEAGRIGSAVKAVMAGAGKGGAVASAPGNHAKIMIVDDELYVVGSDNLYPGFLAEFNFLVEGKEAVNDMLGTYWNQLWRYSGPHASTRQEDERQSSLQPSTEEWTRL